jgi:3-phenylpropionate/trans-cinnamate dioxygenase ferredoxin subunit
VTTQRDEKEEAPYLDLCAEDDLPPGEATAFHANGRDLLLCSTGGEVFAIASRCSHAAWELAGSEIAGGEIVCALHGARFDLRTGEATARPASKPLQTFELRRRQGRIEVRVPPRPR